MKCDICEKEVGKTFLNKIIGAYVKNSSGKRKLICSECQKKFKTKKEILSKLG